MVVNECVIDIYSDITCHVSYELYSNSTSVYLERTFMRSVKGNCRIPSQDPEGLNYSAIC